MMKKIIIVMVIMIVIALAIAMVYVFKVKHINKEKIQNMLSTVNIDSNNGKNESVNKSTKEEKKLKSTKEIHLYDVDGKGKNYSFKYHNKNYKATYTKDNWCITNSYQIKDKDDMKVICQALIDIHPIHGKDMKSYRTADDMVYEWEQHNLAYIILPKGNAWRKHAKDVDFDPADQGRSLDEMYRARKK